MGRIKKYRNIVERFLSGEQGQRFFNFAYSIGAAIVIWGALFKILHLRGGDTLLCIGMGTEVLMFILTAFDRPPREYHWEEVFPELENHHDGKESAPKEGDEADDKASVAAGRVAGASGSVIAPAVGFVSGVVSGHMAVNAGAPAASAASASPAASAASAAPAGSPEQYIDQMTALSAELDRLRDTTHRLNEVSEVLLGSYKAITDNSEAITASSTGYAEEMQALNRNIAGLNTIYGIQLKSVSSQLDAIDKVNKGIKDIRDMYEKSSSMSERYFEETEKMARYMQQLNQVYENMLTAMTVNMPHLNKQ